MTQDDYDLMTAANAEHGAETARTNVETFRSYLAWSIDPDQRRWAESMAHAYEAMALAEATYAAALRARHAEVPA